MYTANAVGVDAACACVSLRFADGGSELLSGGRSGWRAVAAMEHGDMLVVDSGASGPPLAPPATTASAHSTTAATSAVGGTHQRCPVYEVPLSNEQLNHKRLDALLKSEPAEIRKALQQVREHGPPPIVTIAWIDSSIATCVQ